jgi:hypothetical protein
VENLKNENAIPTGGSIGVGYQRQYLANYDSEETLTDLARAKAARSEWLDRRRSNKLWKSLLL